MGGEKMEMTKDALKLFI
jgi:hypothetical protein